MKSWIPVVLFTAACATDPSGPGPEPGEAGDPSAPRAPRIELSLTDAPGDFEAVWVDIARVEIESEQGWITLADQAQRFDLLTLQNDVTAALGGAELAPGVYGQLRMIVDAASVVIGGVEQPLEIASGAQTGIKIDLDEAIEADMVYALTLDYDAAQSVHQTGQGFRMTPVVSVKSFTATPMPPPEEPAPMP